MTGRLMRIPVGQRRAWLVMVLLSSLRWWVVGQVRRVCCSRKRCAFVVKWGSLRNGRVLGELFGGKRIYVIFIKSGRDMRVYSWIRETNGGG